MAYLVLDIETQKEFAEIGGRGKLHLLGVSVVGTYWSGDDTYYAYREEEFPALEEKIVKSDLVIGFNNKFFDFPVLQPHIKAPLTAVPTLDIMEELSLALGYRVSLNSVAKGTLNAGKSGHGLQAIQFFREGRWDELISYCLQDVKLTKEVYEYGRAQGHVKFFAGWESYEVPVRWK